MNMRESTKKSSPKTPLPRAELNVEDDDDESSADDGKLQIISTPEKRNMEKSNPKKRRKRQRQVSTDEDIKTEEALIDEAIEEKLQEIAKKNNLSQIEMKKILRKLVGNEHVLALVKLQEEEEKRVEESFRDPIDNEVIPKKSEAHEDNSYSEKLTRAKARALNKKPIPIQPLNETEPEPDVAALISQDLHSDEEDEEYQPHEEDLVSDDDPNTTISDIDSQPATPNTPATNIQPDTPVHYTNDGIFKVPRDRNDSFTSQTSQHEEIIAKRTRSKLCLQTTPIEAIESNFIPPDITTDMYDIDRDIDPPWMEFLNAFSKPLNTTTTVEEDDETDPEYIAADKVPLDREELRDVNISKKELNDLVAELFDGLLSNEILPDDNNDLETPKKTLERSNEKSPLKKRQKINPDSEFQFENNQIFSVINDNLNTTQNDNSVFNPNVMSTPESNQIVQRFPNECPQQQDQQQQQQQQQNISTNASMQYYNHTLNNFSSTSIQTNQQTSVVTQQSSFGFSNGSISDNAGQILRSSIPAIVPIMPVQLQGINSISPLNNNQPPPLLALHIPGTSNQLPATIPCQLAITPSNNNFGHLIALPNVNNQITFQLKPSETIDLTKTPDRTDHSVTPISPRTESNELLPSAKPTSHPEPNLPQSATLQRSNATKRKKSQATFSDLSYYRYDNWRNGVYLSIKKYMHREYAEKYEALKSITLEEPQFDENQKGFTDLQLQILQQQMRFHVQFAAQNFFQTYSHPEFWTLAGRVKQMLLVLEKHSNEKENSFFNAWNLKPALQLIKEWENELSISNSENRELMDFIYNEIEKAKISNHKGPAMRFHPRIMQRIIDSSVFIYPDLLPKIPFRVDKKSYQEFTLAEDHLIAFGLERFFKELEEHESKNPNFKRKVSRLRLVCERIAAADTIIVGKDGSRILHRVKNQLESEDYNPIKFYFERKKAPPFKHDLKSIDLILPPKDRIPELPLVWKEYALSLKAVRLENIYSQHSNAVNTLKNCSEEVNDSFSRKTLTSTKKLKNTFRQIRDNSINSANIIIHFNYVNGSNTIGDPTGELRKLLNSTNNSTATFEQSKHFTDDDEFLNSNELRLQQVNDGSIDNLVPDDGEENGGLIASNEIDKNLNLNKSKCTILSTASTTATMPCSNVTISDDSNNIIIGNSFSHQVNNRNSIDSTANINDNRTHLISACKKENSPTKGQKLLTDYFSIKNHNSSVRANSSTESTNQLKDSAESNPPPTASLIFKPKLKSKIKWKNRCFGRKKYLSRKNFMKILCERKLNRWLKIKFSYLVESYHKQLQNYREIYKHKDLKCVYMHFKALELYTSLLVDLKMSCKKVKITNSIISEDNNSCVKRTKLTAEHNAANYKVRKAKRINEYLKRMITPESQEELDKKDAVYALNFYDKVEETFKKSGRIDNFKKFQHILKSFDPQKDQVADMYNKIEKLFLPHHPDLAQIFLTFLLPGEAAQIGKFFEQFMLSNMTTFINKLNLYFTKQPAQIKKVYAALNELSDYDDLTIWKIKEKILPLLKGNQFLTEWFIQIFPNERPPERLVTMAENINLKGTEGHRGSGDCENISSEDLISDSSDDQGCQIKYLNGRIFYGSKILLPAKLTFMADELINEDFTDTDNEDDEDEMQEETDSSSVCVHGMRELAEKRLKQATEACDELENIEEDDNGDHSKNYVICDNTTFKAHAIRLNPSLFTSDKENHQQKRTLSPKKIFKPFVSTSSSSSTSTSTSTPSSTLTTINKDKEKRKSPKKNLPKSPGTKRNTQQTNNTSRTDSIELNSKAIGTAKKLKTMIEGNQSTTDDQLKNKKQQQLQQQKNCDKNIDNPKDDSSKDESSKDESSKDVSSKDVVVENKIEIVHPLSDTDSSQGNLSIEKTVPWTRDEDKIILEAVKFGFDNEEILIEKLAKNLPHRTESEIMNRHHFLMDVLTQLQNRS